MDIPEIDTDDAAALVGTEGTVFLDVRDEASHRASHIPGAVHASDATIRDFLDDTDRGAKVVVYCYHGNSSRGGTAFLLEQGFTDVASMRGGFEAWRGRHPHESS